MPPKSRTANVRKICGCVKWKTCAHPWYLDFQRDGVRYRDNLDKLLGDHPQDFTAAQDEVRRVIEAKRLGLDPRRLLPKDDPSLAKVLTAYEAKLPRTDAGQIRRILATPVQSPTGPRPFGEWRIRAITTDVLNEFQRQRPRVAGNRDLALLRAAFNLSVLNRLMPTTPFRVGNVSAVKLHREEGRTRRLHPGEDARLLAYAGRLAPLITAALETGCRRGELLSLQWHQVRFTPRAELFLPAQKTKAKKDRRVPISSVLQPLLEARRCDPAGAPLPPEAFVFGDEIGRPRRSIKTAWLATCRRAGITGLHFHDLRREAGSRWMDAGVPLATIQRWLGHHNISQTSTYLGASAGGDEQDMHAFEAKLGRVAATAAPLTQIDIPALQDGTSSARPDRRLSKKTEQNRITRDAAGTVH